MESGDLRNQECRIHEQSFASCERLGYLEEGKCTPWTSVSTEDSAKQLYQIHAANLKAGFTEAQSMFILAATMGAPVAPPSADD